MLNFGKTEGDRRIRTLAWRISLELPQSAAQTLPDLAELHSRVDATGHRGTANHKSCSHGEPGRLSVRSIAKAEELR